MSTIGAMSSHLRECGQLRGSLGSAGWKVSGLGFGGVGWVVLLWGERVGGGERTVWELDVDGVGDGVAILLL